MASLTLIDADNKKIGSVEVSDSVFDVKVNYALVQQVLKAQMAGWRQGTAMTKTKGLVQGGGKKPFRQKGTGNARQGSSRSPLLVGGGTMFGPVPRSYVEKTPKEMVRGAMRSILSDRAKASRLLVIDSFGLKDGKTKNASRLFSQKLGLNKVLVVDDRNENLERGARNLRGVKVTRIEGLNLYDVVGNEWLLISKDSIEAVQKRYEPRIKKKSSSEAAFDKAIQSGEKS